METVLQNKRSAEETAERHSQEKADLGRQLEAKDKELAECKAGHAAAVEKLESKHAAVVKGWSPSMQQLSGSWSPSMQQLSRSWSPIMQQLSRR